MTEKKWNPFENDWACIDDAGEWQVDVPADRTLRSRVIIASDIQNEECAKAIARVPRFLKLEERLRRLSSSDHISDDAHSLVQSLLNTLDDEVVATKATPKSITKDLKRDGLK